MVRVLANDGGRVLEIDLSGNGLTGEVTDALSALGALERLDLSGNPGLAGELPPGLAELAVLEMVDIEGTGVCAPANAVFQRWASGIDFRGDVCTGSGGGGEFEPPGGEGSGGGGGCAVASSGWEENRPLGTALNLLLCVCLLLLVLRGNRFGEKRIYGHSPSMYTEG